MRIVARSIAGRRGTASGSAPQLRSLLAQSHSPSPRIDDDEDTGCRCCGHCRRRRSCPRSSCSAQASIRRTPRRSDLFAAGFVEEFAEPDFEGMLYFLWRR